MDEETQNSVAAVTEDPQYAPPYAGSADAYSVAPALAEISGHFSGYR
jgi:hypothetical protein